MTVVTDRAAWRGLWALAVGFFMILVDSTIVSVANPAIMSALHADISSVVWVTSAYLLAYAVPLLLAGRLGDRFGPKNLYLLGLLVFTGSSAWCGLAGSIELLILARTVQGVGAALMTPQTMTIITRTFPPGRRGAALGFWGSITGIATLVGPLLGGFLVSTFGWEWIFFVNVPVGVAGMFVAWRHLPRLAVAPQRFDWVGVALSTAGLFLLIFGMQEGQTYHWGTIVGPVSVWSLMLAGLLALLAFARWQQRAVFPLVPPRLFKDRNFALGTVAVLLVGLAITSMPVPLVFYYQTARNLSPLLAAVMLAPMAIVTGVAAPLVGRLTDRWDPKWVAFAGLLTLAGGLAWTSSLLRSDTPLWLLVAPAAAIGLGIAGAFAPLSTAVSRTLAMGDAGAGSGVYNASRQVGAVIGSAAIAALMSELLVATVPAINEGEMLSEATRSSYAAAMGHSMLLPAAAAAVAAILVLFFGRTSLTPSIELVGMDARMESVETGVTERPRMSLRQGAALALALFPRRT